LIGGLVGTNLTLGMMAANWVGYACNFAPYGSLQWRLPLALQIPWGIIMGIGLATFMPNSPRYLIQKGKDEEARKAFIKIRRDLHSHEVMEEFGLMKNQIHFEMERKVPSFKEAFKLYRHRILV
jgi:MFS family permease